MGGTFSSRGAGDDAGTESSQPTTNPPAIPPLRSVGKVVGCESMSEDV